MKLVRFFQYAYLAFALLFTYDAIENWNGESRGRAYMSLLLAATAIFMFFFRKNFNKKMNNKDKT